VLGREQLQVAGTQFNLVAMRFLISRPGQCSSTLARLLASAITNPGISSLLAAHRLSCPSGMHNFI
jgi:hypothetical protein